MAKRISSRDAIVVTVLLALCLGAGLGFAFCVSSSPPPPRSTSLAINLPAAGLNFLNVVVRSGSLYLVESRTPDGSTECLVASVTSSPLKASAATSQSCENPLLEGETVAPFVSTRPIGIGYSRVQIARYVRSTGKVILGPVLATYEDDSGSGLEWTYGPGSLWIYEAETAHGPTVFRISSTTGKLLQETRVPGLTRPELTANTNGLYVAAAGSFGNYGDPGALIYRVGIGARSASTAVRASAPVGVQLVTWLTSQGNALWMDVCTRPLRKPCEIWKFEGADLTPVFHVSDHGLTGDWVVGNATLGLFSSLSLPWQSPAPAEPVPQLSKWRILRIDPESGRTTEGTLLWLPPIWRGPDNFGRQDVALYRGSMYIATPSPNGKLYRVNLAPDH